MCGIAGVFWYGGGVADPVLLVRQSRALRHRGPDGEGLWHEGPVALAHRRLAIVDRSAAAGQPMGEGPVRVTFNGEVYDWPEARTQLIARGRPVRTRCDAEWLLHLWDEHGTRMVDGLDGMFAFALYDRRTRTLMMARDPLGKKPLYYHDDGRRIVFASELGALLIDPSVPRDVDPRAIVDFLGRGYVPGPGTIYRGVRRVPPGHRLTCDARGVQVEPFWDMPLAAEEPGSERETLERLEALLVEAVRVRMRADVPLGALLSGGLDSSAVVALMAEASARPVRTFSVGFEGDPDSELPYARAVARHLGTEHHELVLGPECLALLPGIVGGMDEPFADNSILPTSCLARFARESVTVALSGDGGDEAFLGYSTYARADRRARADILPLALRRGLAGIGAWMGASRGLRELALDPAQRHLEGMSAFNSSEVAGLLSRRLRAEARGHDPYAGDREFYARALPGLGRTGALAALDVRTYLADDILVKVDRASMRHGLEVRSPLLDRRVIEFALRLPTRMKSRDGVTKRPLRALVHSRLPGALVERPKRGFSIPVERWYDRGLRTLARDILLDGRALDRGWLDPVAMERLLAPEERPGGRAAAQAFTLLSLELWAQTHLDRPRAAALEGEEECAARAG